ncbi:histidinol dehydrogenase [Alkalitalea saponilacus]|uniref:Histidinol dehydrogenase n=1 Tax=Alkalitalea saponilacus TaxID=889453 RepID=A0A1T5AJD4_9BACT|nr:histidinol dehydrogenase [Alkalitalea saponilacus]ASB48678.1 histidinol dehydrogenase [Alkalitalea saponilacus]SKB35111.1 histidinol dehydrogenase [Alkalitalea saponilacus]
MQTYVNPPRNQWDELLQRPQLDVSGLYEQVQSVLDEIEVAGDQAVLKYSRMFDGYEGAELQVGEEEIAAASSKITKELKSAIETAAQNIKTFHATQWQLMEKVETQPGVTCWQKNVPIEKVGLYVPGGTAPLFSTVLMLGVPAKIAGCREIILCTPPGKDGKIHPAILYAASVAGIDKIYKIGGIQAIGAMTFGTESVPKVYKIFGPGNKYVTAAKQLVSLKNMAIDMPAGPSEVLIMADESANPAFVAADLLSQAEHGAGSQVILLTTVPELLDAVMAEVEKQVKSLPREDGARGALNDSRAFLLTSIDEMIKMSDLYAPEHLILAVNDAEEVADRIINAGSVFIGHYTPESAGDYASGTNHTLPTYGHARTYSGVNIDSYIRKVTFQHITPEGLKQLGPVIQEMAAAEMLDAHKNAVTIRLNEIGD